MLDETEVEIVEGMVKILGNFIWLGNNLHNFYTPQFRTLFENSLKEAREAYNKGLDLWKKYE